MIPLRLVLENFISHVRSELDFTKFDAALLVGSHSGNPYISNGVGKTSIFNGMRWALTGKSRFSKKDKVVKRGKEFCKVVFEFKIENDIYRIVRKLSKRSNIIDVVFSKKIGGKWENEGLTCDTSTMTNKKIVEIIKMSDDTFVNSVYFKQNDVSGFASATTSKRKEILKEILQIGIWDVYQQIAKDNVKQYETQRNNLNDRLKIIGNVESQKNENKEKLKFLQLEIEKSNKEIKDLEAEFYKQKQLVSNLETIISQKGGFNFSKLKEEKKSISVRASEIKNKLNELADKIKDNNSIIANSNNDCNNLEEKLVKLSKKVMKVSGFENKEICSKFEPPKNQYSQASLDKNIKDLNDHNKILNSLKQDFGNLNAVRPGNECPTCLSNIDNLQDIEKRRKEKKKFIKSRISQEEKIIEQLFEEVKKEQNAINNAKDALIEMERTEIVITKRMSAYSEAIHCNEIFQLERKNLGMALEKLKEEYNKINNILNNVKKDEDIHTELERSKLVLDEISNNVEKCKKDLLDLSVQYGMIKGYGEELERRNSERIVIENQLKIISQEIDVYKNLSKAFSKDGIQAIIMENVTEDLRKYTNAVLKQICSDPMSIDFITQSQTVTGSWKEQFEIKISVGSSDLDFDDLSGGEQVRVSIALRLAISQLLMRRVGSNVKFLLLDEVDQALDRQGIDALASAILLLSKKLKILVITHNEGMKEKFENIITIQKGSAGSILSQ